MPINGKKLVSTAGFLPHFPTFCSILGSSFCYSAMQGRKISIQDEGMQLNSPTVPGNFSIGCLAAVLQETKMTGKFYLDHFVLMIASRMRSFRSVNRVLHDEGRPKIPNIHTKTNYTSDCIRI